MPAEIVTCRERDRGGCGICLDAGGKDLLLVGSETAELPLPFAGPNRGFEVHPQPVADPIEEVKHWPKIGAGRSCQERRGGGAVAIAVAVPLDEPEARHRIGADPQGPTR